MSTRSKRKRGGEDESASVESAAKRSEQPTLDAFRVSRRVAESAEEAAARERKNNPYQLEWKQHGTLMYLESRAGAPVPLQHSTRVAAFDMDGNLIRTRSGRKFPTGRTDWLWLLPSIPGKLRQLHADGWAVMIFTNQNGISTGNQSAADIRGKILDIIKDAGVPMHAFVASADDLYRKPAVDMWKFMERSCNGGLTADKAVSVYVGDAAGRPAQWDGSATTKKDFSASDRKFAFNVGVTFYTPEEYFLDAAPAPFSWGGIDPTLIHKKVQDPATPHTSAIVEAAVAAAAGSADPAAAAAASWTSKPGPAQRRARAAAPASPSSAAAAASPSPSPVTASVAALTLGSPIGAAAAAAAASSPSPAAAASPAAASALSPPPTVYHTSTQELVIFVGLPAAGKSSFARKHLVPHGYVHVNQDTLKTKEKCVKACAAGLGEGKSVVVDNTNPTAEVRALYTALARKHALPVRCFHFVTKEEVAKHLNMFREKLTKGAHKHVPRIAYNMFKSKFQTPTLKEGFREIKAIDFEPYFANTTEGEEAKALFYQMS